MTNPMLRDLFDINYELILFANGLVFFVMGLAVSLQSRRYSQLQLARSLNWLAVFGIAQGLHEWGLLFIPIQALYMNHFGISLLQLVQILLLGVANFALFTFGAELLWERWSRINAFAFACLFAWALTVLALRLRSDYGVGWLQQQATIWASYLLVFPGALVAAYGLRYQAERQIRALGIRSIYTTTLLASMTLVLYGLVSALFVPYADFFPANVFNQSLLVRASGIPLPVLLSLIGLVLAMSVTRILEVFDLETDRVIHQMSLEQGVAAERQRIGRELHDGVIQIIYTAGLIIESAHRRITDDEVLSQRLETAMTALNEAVGSLRSNMTDLRRESADSSLAEGLRERTQDPRLTALMSVETALDLPEEAILNPIQTTHVLAIVSEALANAARHARPSHVAIQATSDSGYLLVRIRDNGDGFSPDTMSKGGYGMRNMRDRARLLGGELTIESTHGAGSCVELRVPLEAL